MLQCPCGRTYEVDDSLTGRRLRCGCGRILTIGTTIVYEPPRREQAGVRSESRGTPPQSGRDAGIPGWGVLAIVVGSIAVMLLVAPRDPTVRSGGSVTTRSPAASTGVRGASAPPDHSRDLAPANPVACKPADVIRPRTSQELGQFYLTGHGRLTISNGTAMDAVAVLVRASDRTPYRAIYIRTGERGVFTRVARGRYYLQFQFGVDWLRERRFCEVQGVSQFVDPLEFEEFYDYDGVTYTTFEVTLHPVTGGNARTERIPATQFQLPPL